MSDICVASHHASMAALLDDPEFKSLANRDGFLIELRLDYYSDLSTEMLDRVLAAFAPNVIVTFRHPQEGGKNASASDVERLQMLQHAADYGVKYIDIEARTPRPKFRKNSAKLILSFHDFKGLPAAEEGLLRLVNSLMDHPEIDVAKIACFPKTVDESVPLLELLIGIGKSGIPAIILAMGEAGFWTRVAGALFGSPLTYARGEGAPGTAPGQPTWRQLEEVYRYREIKPGWPVYGVIGNPIAHSLSPLLHNTALRATDTDGVYIPFKVEGDPLAFVKKFTQLGLKGISVTIPHKEAVCAACNQVDSVAEAIGAVNTLVLRPDGTWWGGNTDADAAADSLEATAGTLKNKNVVVLGAGGAARAVAFGIKTKGAELFFLNRTPERAKALAAVTGGKMIGSLADVPRVDVIVNTTPLGMHPNVDTSPLTKEQIPKDSIVFDTVYNPLRTKLLSMAEQAGCKTLSGAEMFVAQGLKQFELFTGVVAPRTVVELAVLSALKERQAQQR